MMEPRLTSRHAGFYFPQCWCHHSVSLWIYSHLPPDCVPLETRIWMIYGWFLEPSHKDRPSECLQNVFVQQMDQWARSMETFTLSGFSSSIVSQQNFRHFLYVPFGDGLPGFPACPYHSRAWVWEWGTSASHTVFVLSHEVGGGVMELLLDFFSREDNTISV